MSAVRKVTEMAEPAGKIDFGAFVSGLPIKFLICRADGHGPWRAMTASWDNEAKVYDRKRRCGNCGTVKPQMLDAEGYIVGGGTYQYPKGYLATHVDLPPPGAARAAYRLAATRHQMSEPSKPSKRRLKSVQ